MVKKLLVAVLVSVSAVVFAVAQESELRQLAREPDVTVQIMSAYEPATFEMIAKEADTVVVGKP